MEAYATMIHRGGTHALQEAARFFTRDNPVFETLRRVTAHLKESNIPHAVPGGMALVAHGYFRTTEDVDILVSPASISQIQAKLVGLGYQPIFEGSKNLRDTATGVRIEFFIAGQFPGDGKPKPVAFPEPAQIGVEIDGMHYVGLQGLIELKLASGMTHPGRLRDLADVQELFRVLKLSAQYADQLNPFVRDQFKALATALNPTNETS